MRAPRLVRTVALMMRSRVIGRSLIRKSNACDTASQPPPRSCCEPPRRRRASFLQAAHHGHDLLGKPAHGGQNMAMWYKAARVEPTDQLIHLALRIYLLDLFYAGRGR